MKIKENTKATGAWNNISRKQETFNTVKRETRTEEQPQSWWLVDIEYSSSKQREDNKNWTASPRKLKENSKRKTKVNMSNYSSAEESKKFTGM